MKKILLMMVALVATVSISAQDDEGWSKSFAPVSDKAELGGLCTAVAGDGSVYASSTYNQAFTFAGKAVTDPEGLTSSCVVKYDKDGAEQWAISLVGDCEIYAMTADADGTLYVAGKTEDTKIIVTGTDGAQKEIVNAMSDPWGIGEYSIDSYAAFVIKISNSGVVEAIKTISPETNAEVASSEFPFYLPDSEFPIDITPSKIVIDGNKVLVSATYYGDVKDGDKLIWEGSYAADLDFGMYFDNRSRGILMLNKSDLSGMANVAYVKATGVPEVQVYPQALDFVVYNGVPYVAFIGFGNLTLTTPAGSKDFSFEMLGEGNNEHALVLANATEPEKSKVFNAAPNDYLGATYSLGDAAIAGDACILAGTFYGQFPLDNAITVDENAAFVASIDMKECTLNWRYIPNVHAEATCMIVTGEETHLATAEKKYTVKTADGKEKDIMEQGFADASSYNDQYCSTIFADDTNVCIFSPKLSPSNVKAAQDVQNGTVKVYTLEGIERPALQKGLNLIKTAEGTQKVLK